MNVINNLENQVREIRDYQPESVHNNNQPREGDNQDTDRGFNCSSGLRRSRGMKAMIMILMITEAFIKMNLGCH